MLRDDMASSGTGVIVLTDGGEWATTGLANSGTIQVADEQMTYSTKTKNTITITARGVGGTTAAAHKANDAVMVVDGGVATDAHLVKKIGWKRFGGTSYPMDYRFKVSKLPNAGGAGDSDLSGEWTEVYNTATDTASSKIIVLSPAQRVRSLLMQIERMTVTTASRPRINEMIAEVDPVTSSSPVLPDGSSAGTVLQTLLDTAMLPPGLLTVTGTTMALSGFTTADDRAWAVIADFADYARLRLMVKRDSHFAAINDPFWAAGAMTHTQMWTRANAKAVQRQFTSNEDVSQVETHWRSPDNLSSGVVRYPTSPWADGKVEVIGDAIFPDAAAATAATVRRFFLRRFPYVLLVETATPVTSLEPGAIHSLTWAFDPTQPTSSTRLFLLRSVELSIERLEWGQVLEFLEIERQSDS
jgi:hypothetical protein